MVVTSVLEASKNEPFAINDKDVIAITESVVARSQGNYATVDDILRRAEERGEAPFIVICDGIEDPHNLGAIIRSCEAGGAHGVIVPEDYGEDPADVAPAASLARPSIRPKRRLLGRRGEEGI